MTHRLRFALLAAVLALPACTAFRTTSTERASLLSDAPLPMDRTCRSITARRTFIPCSS